MTGLIGPRLPSVRGEQTSKPTFDKRQMSEATLEAATSKRRFRLPAGLVLVLPALIFLTAFMVYPVANLIYLSFHDYSPLRSADVTWVGIDNYVTAADRARHI